VQSGSGEVRRPLGACVGEPLALAWQRSPLCPELELHLLAPGVDVEREARHFAAAAPPFWAFAWAAGQVLARYLLDHAEAVRGRRVVDLGTGSGIAAIAAARAGAAEVDAVDLDPEARAAAAANAGRNGVSIRVAPGPRGEPGPGDLWLASDVAYESGALALLRRAAARGAEVLLADPERHGPLELPLCARWRAPARTWPELDEPTTGAAVFAWPAGGAAAPLLA